MHVINNQFGELDDLNKLMEMKTRGEEQFCHYSTFRSRTRNNFRKVAPLRKLINERYVDQEDQDKYNDNDEIFLEEYKRKRIRFLQMPIKRLCEEIASQIDSISDGVVVNESQKELVREYFCFQNFLLLCKDTSKIE